MNDREEYVRTRETYEAIAPLFAEEWDRPEVTAEALVGFVELLPSEALVLDVGAGPGRDARALTRNGATVVAGDLSMQMLHEARARGTERLLACDMRALPFRAASFDALWACASFLHILKHDAAGTLHGFRRVLRTGGTLFVSVKQGVGEAWRERYGRERFYVFYVEDELDDLLRRTGFEPIAGRVIPDELGRDPWIERLATAI